MQLFYGPKLNPDTPQFTFSQEESKHMVKVLRKKVDDLIFITNGNGYLFKSKILEADEKKCTVAIISVTQKEKRPYQLHLAVAPTKMNDRFEWFLEKATEIGVDRITPLLCENSERKIVKMERMEKVVQAAMKQSLQTYMPQVDQPIAFKDFIKGASMGQLFIAHCGDGVRKNLKLLLVPNMDTTLLIGPEGDFSPAEIDLALANGFLPVSLGENRLRTETAALFACATVALAHG